MFPHLISILKADLGSREARENYKMKAIRKIGMALFAVLVSVNIASCSPDNGGESQDDSPSNQPSIEKKLVKILEYCVRNNELVLDDIIEFKYDTKGNVVEILKKQGDGNNNWEVDTTECVWDSNKSMTYYWDKGDNDEYVKYSLSDGKITDICYHYYGWNPMTDEHILEENFYHLAYGKDGNLVEAGENKLTWSNGKLKMVENGYNLISIHYGEQTCKGFFPLFIDYACDELWELLFWAQPELLGIKTTYLPEKIVDGDDTTTFEYEFDVDGYIERCAETDRTNYTLYYDFVWE